MLEAYQQLLLYRENLDDPPLLVVSDLDRFEVHTDFTGKPAVVFAFSLNGRRTEDGGVIHSFNSSILRLGTVKGSLTL